MPHRTTSRLGAAVRGLSALAVLIALIAAVPLALARVGVLPAHIPSWHDITTALTSPDSGGLFLGTLTVIGWAAWLSFTLSVLVEVGALLRHRRAPRLRVLGPAQRMAASLVAGVVLLLPTSGAFADAPTASATTATAPAAVHTGTGTTTAPALAAAGPQAWSGPVHQVVRGDTLWDLAQHYLGSGTRWHEIAQLNTGLRQSDGTVLSADVLDLQPGWTLRLPADTAPAAASLPAPSPATTSAVSAPGTEASWPTHTVASATETPWSLAVRYLGDGQRWADIAALNPNLPGLAADRDLPQGAVIRLPADARPADPASPAAAAAPAGPAAQQAADRAATPTPAASEGDGTRHVTVHQGDSLSSIAAATYGDATGWPVIFDANRGEALPDGGRFTDPDLIYPGQQLDLPGTRTGAPAPAAPAPTAAQPAPAGHGASTDEAGSSGQAAGAPATVPGIPAPTPAPAATPSADAGTPSPSPSTAGSAQIPAPASLAPTDRPQAAPTHALAPAEVWLGAGAMAAALLGAVALRRRLQQRRLFPGRHIPLPTGRAAATEQSLRATQHPAGFDLLDRALRTLAVNLAAAGRELPVLEAVVLHESRVDLHLSEAGAAMAPFMPAPGRKDVWTCSAGSADLADEDDLTDADTPYPALVSIGWDDKKHLVLVDLEHIGVLHLAGDPAFARHVLQAVAVELATTPLPGHLEIAALGNAAPGLESAAPERVARTADLAEAAADLIAHTDDQRRALNAIGAHCPRAARLSDEAGDAWTPRIVLAEQLPAGHSADLIVDALTRQPRTAAAVITTTAPGDAAAGSGWSLTCHGPQETVVLPGSGVTVHLQGLSDEHFADAVDILALASSDSDVPPPDWITQPARDNADAGPAAPLHAAEEGEDWEDGLPAEYADLEQETGEGLPALGAGAVPDPILCQVPHQPLQHLPARAAEGEDEETPGLSLADVLAEEDDREHSPRTGPVDVPEAVAAARPATSTVPAPLAAASTLAHRRDREAEPAAPGSAPAVLLLGPIAIEGAAGRVDSNRRRTATELLAYLALNPGVDHHGVDAALWPGQLVGKQVRNALISRARSWLASDPDGNAYFPRIQDTGDNRYRLASSVACDWTRFQHHARTGLGDFGEDGDLALRRALALVRGRPFAGIDPGRYGWAEPAVQGMVSEIARVAYELSTRRLEAGDVTGALWAARRGLIAAEENELLHRCVFRALHAAGDIDALRASAALLTKINQQLGDVDMEAETAALLQELLPRPVPVR